MKILILGGTGFIGSKILKLIKKKHIVKNLSLSSGIDLRKPNKLDKYLKSYKLIINCAAHVGNLNYIDKKRADILNDNLKIYLNMYSSIKNSVSKPKVINLISNCVYPSEYKLQKEKLIFSGSVHQSVEPFGLPKLILLKLSLFYFKQYNIKSLNLVLPNAFGPGDHIDTNRSHALNGIIVRMLDAIKNNNKVFEIWGSGKPKREWIFAEDVAKIVELTIKREKLLNNFKIINVAQNKSYSINYLASKIKKILCYKGKLKNNKNFPDGALLKQLDNKLFKNEYKGFKFSNFEKALKKTINYYKS